MRWLVTGPTGLLGSDLVALLALRGHPTTAPMRADLDLLDADAVRAAVAGHDVVVSCAAWTAVDDAEAHEAEALRVNAEGPRLLARACAATGARLVQVSTDYVFAGDASTPYAEDAPVAPRTAYGRTKAAGEQAVREELPDAHLVLRTAWLYGVHGRSFPRTLAERLRAGQPVEVVTDQRGQPTWSADLARVLVDLVEAGAAPGTYHATAAGAATWHDLGREVARSLGLDPDLVRPTTSAAFPRPAPRPPFSVLGGDRVAAAGVLPVGDWRERWRVAAPDVLGVPAQRPSSPSR